MCAPEAYTSGEQDGFIGGELVDELVDVGFCDIRWCHGSGGEGEVVVTGQIADGVTLYCEKPTLWGDLSDDSPIRVSWGVRVTAAS